jgi:hypothetical protein
MQKDVASVQKQMWLSRVGAICALSFLEGAAIVVAALERSTYIFAHTDLTGGRLWTTNGRPLTFSDKGSTREIHR